MQIPTSTITTVPAQKTGWDLVLDLKTKSEQSNIVTKRLDWQFNAYMLEGNQLLYRDVRNNKIIVLTPGEIVPVGNGKFKQVPYNIVNYPVDPHICTISRSVTAQVIANELTLEVQPGSSDTKARKIAKNSSIVLQYYQRQLDFERLREDAVEWLKPCGICFLKLWWDTEKGGQIDDPTSTPDAKETISMGDINARIAVPFAMMIPPGQTSMDDLDMIGEKIAMPIRQIKDIWGVEVPEDLNLHDIKTLAIHKNDTQLREHAMVYEVFVKPNKDFPQGYHVIAANGTVLNETPYFDKLLQAKFPQRWHPYVMIPYLKQAGEFWPKSMFDSLMSMQIELNKKRKQISDSKDENKKPIIIHDPGAVDWEKVNLDPEKGWPRIERKIPGANVQVEWPVNFNQDLEQQAESIINRMNDLASSYEESRGANSPDTTSGKQVQLLQSAANQQGGPLLHNVAKGFIDAGERVLELASVHLSQIQLGQIEGENNETISADFKPEDITSKNIQIFGGNGFFLSPEAKSQQIDMLAQMGALGNIQDPKVRSQYLKLKEMPALEEFYDESINSETMAEYENYLFGQGILKETNTQLAQQISDNFEKAQLASNMMALNGQVQKEQQHQQIMNAAASGMIPSQVMNRMGPPPQPQPLDLNQNQLPAPPPWRRARLWDDDDVHIAVLDRWRESQEFEDLCEQFPDLVEATNFHKQDHLNNKMKKMQQMMSPLGPPGMVPPNQAVPPVTAPSPSGQGIPPMNQ